MIARTAASVLVAGTVVLGAAGCSFFAPQATLIQYQPSDGTAATIGDVAVRNAVAITDDGENASLVLALINEGEKKVTVDFQYVDANDDKVTVSVVAEPGINPVGYDDGTEVVLTDIDAKVGGLFPVYVQFGDEPGKSLSVPVLDDEQSHFSEFVPTVTPTPTATP